MLALKFLTLWAVAYSAAGCSDDQISEETRKCVFQCFAKNPAPFFADDARWNYFEVLGQKEYVLADGTRNPYYLHYVGPTKDIEVLYVWTHKAHKNVAAHEIYINGTKFDRSEGLESITESGVQKAAGLAGRELTESMWFQPICISACLGSTPKSIPEEQCNWNPVLKFYDAKQDAFTPGMFGIYGEVPEYRRATVGLSCTEHITTVMTTKRANLEIREVPGSDNDVLPPSADFKICKP